MRRFTDYFPLFLQLLKLRATKILFRLQPIDVCFFVTVRRELDDYFDPSIGSLLEGLDPRERRALYLNVLFADTDPTRHPSWGQNWVDRLTDTSSSYNVSGEQLAHLQAIEKDKDFHEKGVYDYIYALRACQVTNAPYIAIFEDDIILAEGWMTKTLKALADINHIVQNKTSWIYLRLFYTETALSWTSSDFAYRNMPLIFGLMMLLTIGCLLVLRRFPICHSYLDYPTVFVISLVCVPAFTALVYMMGKYNIMPLRGVVEMNTNGCCTQALVFPRAQVDDLVRYLEEKRGQTDLLIEEYAEQTGLTRYALAPPQLQHVGLKSSRGNADIHTQSTWAFWFEDNDPITLKREHEDLLRSKDIGNILQDHN
ncbi:uncharacterized protein ATNIH1004_005247 [Aspergillus tanneri]|uniref:Uncharacterized protein n=1 Tax=Aspergillus tanneri TaxID=1220188 RepID=A0A5M9MTR9_9EURO|nr:uncharacterized protein ATNIH1004_005247 [Aspergillus tanneri]KAA8649346.1 hypothetical protein ATNIH1004_005247 [Aspergillus tanneri]